MESGWWVLRPLTEETRSPSFKDQAEDAESFLLLQPKDNQTQPRSSVMPSV